MLYGRFAGAPANLVYAGMVTFVAKLVSSCGCRYSAASARRYSRYGGTTLPAVSSTKECSHGRRRQKAEAW